MVSTTPLGVGEASGVPVGSDAPLPSTVSGAAPSLRTGAGGDPFDRPAALVGQGSSASRARGAGRALWSGGGVPALSVPLNAPLSVLSAVVTSLGMTQNVFP